jgi:hypothetical protein
MTEKQEQQPRMNALRASRTLRRILGSGAPSRAAWRIDTDDEGFLEGGALVEMDLSVRTADGDIIRTRAVRSVDGFMDRLSLETGISSDAVTEAVSGELERFQRKFLAKMEDLTSPKHSLAQSFERRENEPCDV